MPDRIDTPLNAIIMTLEDIIARADAGEIESLAVVGINKDGGRFSGAVVGKDPISLVGAIEAEKVRLLLDHDLKFAQEVERISLEGI